KARKDGGSTAKAAKGATLPQQAESRGSFAAFAIFAVDRLTFACSALQRIAPVEREAGALAHARVAGQKCGPSTRDPRQHVAALCLFLDQYPLREGPWIIQRSQPDVAVAFVQKLSDRIAAGRGLLHVVPERSHARHDLSRRIRAVEA